MNVLKIVIGIFVAAWVFIIYDIVNAPVVDENGNIIKEEDK
tara:strand:- start:4 stop:126 length:123 start_codon:yes stop_codon:yes gene_type:complete